MPDQHAVWERIAASFDRSRTRPWPHVTAFLETLEQGGRVLDLMCGNGRHVPTAQRRRLDLVGLDWSRPLCRIVARRHRIPIVAGDAARLPFRDGAFDACVYVAGLHGLPTADARHASLAEMRRVLGAGGRAQVTVWSRDAPRFRHRGAPGEPLDTILPWRGDGHREERHYHLYTREALRRDMEAAGLEVLREDAVAVASDEPDNLVVEARA